MSWQVLKTWFRRLLQPQAWAVKDFETGSWHKVVCYGRPYVASPADLYLNGPFRSEQDCEDFCDRLNASRGGRVPLYQLPDPVRPTPPRKDC